MIIDGKAMASKRLEVLRSKISDLKSKIKLVAIIVGNDPSSQMYVKLKTEKAREVGIESETIHLSENITVIEIINFIEKLNRDRTVTGILVQLPLPKHLDTRKILRAIDPAKDVDGLTGRSDFLPATVKGILTVLDEVLGYRDQIVGKDVTIIGRSEEVGKPLAIALIDLGATVTICNSKTENLELKTKSADILISATGQPKLVTKDMIKQGAIVIDVGYPDGDVDFVEVSKVASAITPVPGGIGPLTVVSLLENTLEAALQISNF